MQLRNILTESSFLVFVLSSIPATASVLSFTTCTPALASFSLGSPATGTITCPQFAPSLGTLLDYIVTTPNGSAASSISPTFSASATFFNSNSTPFTSTLLPVQNLQLTYGVPGSPMVDNYQLAASNPSGFTIPANGSLTVALNIFLSLGLNRAVTPLSLVTGTGTFSFNYMVEIQPTNIIPGISVTAASFNNWDVSPTIGFQYEPVPEPSSAMLLGSAVGFAALIRSLRR